MHIIYIVLDPGIPIGGTKGAAIHVETITSALAAVGHQVTILATHQLPETASSCPVRLLTLPSHHRRTVKELRGLTREHRPDYRLDRDLRACLTSALSTPGLVEQLRELRGDVILERLSLFGIAGLEAAHACTLPHALEMNAPLVSEASRHRGLTLGPLATALEEEVLRGTGCVLPVSRGLATYCRRLGVAEERLRVVPNGVDTERFRPRGVGNRAREELGFAPTDRVVGMVSTLRPWHGGLDLARAFTRLAAIDPRARLLVVGEGPDAEAMRKVIARSGHAEHARFVGATPHDQVPALIECMDITVAPYRPAEDFYFSPLKLYEYMAMERAVVASGMGQINELITEGVNGRRVAPADPAALTEVLVELARDDGQCRRLGEQARATVELHHTWRRAALEITDVLEGLREEARCSASS